MKILIFAIVWIMLAMWYYYLFNNYNNMNANNDVASKILLLKEKENGLKSAYFAWGCFWCMEWIFEAQEWVKEAITWYAWWTKETAKYDIVSTWTTKHRETVKVIYDPDKISYEKLVKLFWTQIDPTDPDGQFADKWFQYTTAIFYSNDKEKAIAMKEKEELENSKKFEKKIATQIIPFTTFFDAEEYHQDYYKKSSLRYNLYKKWSWREWFIENNWEKDIEKLNSEKTQSWNNLVPNKQDMIKNLTPLQYDVTQNGWTEKPFKNEYWDNHEEWIYVDIVDWTPLFSSLDKYDSWTGWPSFTKPISLENIIEEEDNTLFSTRTEVRSKKADSHLGHVFNDWPEDKWWLRFCMNSASLRFVPLEDLEKEGYGEYIKLFK